MHDSGTHRGSKRTLVKSISRAHGVLVTSYSGALANKESLLEQHFDYVILDEGHKIRNPDALVTLAVKMFATPHRLILSGRTENTVQILLLNPIIIECLLRSS